MSLHFTLAKKLISHAKDLIRHIFNEAGHDAKALEQKFLQALKEHAADELQKAEDKVGDSLQHWERAPKPDQATQPYAPIDMGSEEDEDEGEPKGDASATSATPSASPSGSSVASETAAGDVYGEKSADDSVGAQKDANSESSPDSGTSYAAPVSDAHTFGDADAPSFEPKDATPPDTSALPSEGAASVHGEPWPSSGVTSQAAADEGKDLGAGSELDLPKEQTNDQVAAAKTDDAAAPAADVSPTDAIVPPSDAAKDAGEDKAKEQADAPIIADGTVKVGGTDSVDVTETESTGVDPKESDESEKQSDSATSATVNENGGGAAAVVQKLDGENTSA